MPFCCDDYGQCTRGPNCPARETPHDKAARHFWEPNQALHIEAYTGPSRLHRVLDWVGNYADAAKTGFFNAFRDAWAVLPSLLVAACVVLACIFAAGVVVGFAK